MKNKVLLTIFSFFVVLVLALAIFVYKEDNKKQFCTATVYSDFKIPNNESTYKVDMKLARDSSKSGYVSLVGTITTDKTYSINRNVSFDLIPDTGRHELDLIVKNEKKAKNDNVSDEVFNKYFKVFSLNASGYVVINEITPDVYLFSSSLGPYFVCMLKDGMSTV